MNGILQLSPVHAKVGPELAMHILTVINLNEHDKTRRAPNLQQQSVSASVFICPMMILDLTHSSSFQTNTNQLS
jgi:hypothetical protein